MLRKRININLAKEVKRLAWCHKLTCRPGRPPPFLEILLRKCLKTVPLNLPIVHQEKALGATADPLQGLSNSPRRHQQSCSFPPVILDSVHLSQAPGDLGYHVTWCHPGPGLLASFAFVNIMHCTHIFFFCCGQLKVSDTNFYSAVIQILHSQHNP